MSIKDVIKSSVYGAFTGESGLSAGGICLILFASLLAGFYIFSIYKLFTKSAFYSKDMNITLAGTTIIVAAIMVAMQSSLVVALGMVGALSIVRFRTAIKSPLDLMYLFWSVSIGIICGVGLYTLAVLLCIMMTILIYVLNRFPGSRAPILIVIRAEQSCSIEGISSVLKNNCKRMKENSCIIKNGERELIIEMESPNENVIIQQLGELEGIISVNILRHTGEMRV